MANSCPGCVWIFTRQLVLGLSLDLLHPMVKHLVHDCLLSVGY